MNASGVKNKVIKFDRKKYDFEFCKDYEMRTTVSWERGVTGKAV